MTEQTWLGYFAIDEEHSFNFLIGAHGEIQIMVRNKEGTPIETYPITLKLLAHLGQCSSGATPRRLLVSMVRQRHQRPQSPTRHQDQVIRCFKAKLYPPVKHRPAQVNAAGV